MSRVAFFFWGEGGVEIFDISHYPHPHITSLDIGIIYVDLKHNSNEICTYTKQN